MESILLYENLLELGTLSADSTASGYDVANLTDHRGYMFWKSALTADQNIDLTLTENENADTIGIYNHNLGTIGATIQLKINTGSTWQVIAELSPTDDSIILLPFSSQSSDQWRIAISNISGAPQIGIIYLGLKIEFPTKPDSPVIPANEGLVANMEISKSGNQLGVDIRYFPINTQFKWSTISTLWVDTYFKPFWKNHARYLKPFFFAWDLDNNPTEVYWLHIKSDSLYNTPYSKKNYVDEINLSVEGVSGDI